MVVGVFTQTKTAALAGNVSRSEAAVPGPGK
jgi:hypothetical protein